MNKKLLSVLVLAAILLLTACNKPIENPVVTVQPTNILPLATEAATEIPPTETPHVFTVDPVDPATVAYDFVAEVCSAAWSTNATYFALSDKSGRSRGSVC